VATLRVQTGRDEGAQRYHPIRKLPIKPISMHKLALFDSFSVNAELSVPLDMGRGVTFTFTERPKQMTKVELISMAQKMAGNNIEALPTEKLVDLMTVTQYLTDLCLNEIERRGELEVNDGTPVVPYGCDYYVPTILTRPR
jgi:hypothetical protein